MLLNKNIKNGKRNALKVSAFFQAERESFIRQTSR